MRSSLSSESPLRLVSLLHPAVQHTSEALELWLPPRNLGPSFHPRSISLGSVPAHVDTQWMCNERMKETRFVNIQVLFLDFNQQGLKLGLGLVYCSGLGCRTDSVVKAQGTDLQEGARVPRRNETKDCGQQRPHGHNLLVAFFFLSLNNCQSVFR